MFKIATTVVAALLLTAAPCLAQTTPRQSGDRAAISRALEYLDAYERLDVTELSQLYAEGADFVDETSLAFPKPFMWTGRDAILAGIGEWKSTVRGLDYRLTDAFESAGRVVFVGTVDSTSIGPNGDVTFIFPVVTVVTLEGGLVVEHRDYADYAGATRRREGE